MNSVSWSWFLWTPAWKSHRKTISNDQQSQYRGCVFVSVPQNIYKYMPLKLWFLLNTKYDLWSKAYLDFSSSLYVEEKYLKDYWWNIKSIKKNLQSLICRPYMCFPERTHGALIWLRASWTLLTSCTKGYFDSNSITIES